MSNETLSQKSGMAIHGVTRHGYLGSTPHRTGDLHKTQISYKCVHITVLTTILFHFLQHSIRLNFLYQNMPF